MRQSFFKNVLFVSSIFSLTVCLACNDNNDTAATTSTADSSTVTHAIATLSGTKSDTTVNGTLQFDKDGDKTKMHLQITVPTKANQTVAVHIHDHGDCGDMGKSAMGHWNPTGENHGKWGSASFHSGDIGNIQLDANGSGSMDLETDRWSIGGDARTNILDKSIIVHSGVDDYTSQPTGNSGERIGCGVITKSGE